MTDPKDVKLICNEDTAIAAFEVLYEKGQLHLYVKETEGFSYDGRKYEMLEMAKDRGRVGASSFVCNANGDSSSTPIKQKERKAATMGVMLNGASDHQDEDLDNQFNALQIKNKSVREPHLP